MERSLVRGLSVSEGFVPVHEQERLINRIDEAPWGTELKRRVQHYGYRYEYHAKRVGTIQVPPLPDWAESILNKTREMRITFQRFDQLIVNEYLPGQGIAPHVDDAKCFDNEILSLSLGSACMLKFGSKSGGARFELLLEPGDLLLMKDEARYLWRHEIARRKFDRCCGSIFARGRRLSATFRRFLH